MTKVTEYKGYDIYVDVKGKWTANKKGTQDQVAEAPSMRSLEKHLNDMVNAQLGQTVFVLTERNYASSDGEIKKGKVTSMVKRGSELAKARVAFERTESDSPYGPDWAEYYCSSLLKDTPENRALIAKWVIFKGQRESIAKEMDRLVGKMEKHKQEDFIQE
jgi:hypothetical protein